MTARSCAWLRTAQTARTRAREKPAAATRSISNLDRDRLLHPPEPEGSHQDPGAEQDRKSTRLNSSHSQISYAVFCLKKKKQQAKPWPSLAVDVLRTLEFDR